MERSMSSSVPDAQSRVSDTYAYDEANSSGLSWSAVIAGAFVMAALFLILLVLGTGMGLSAASPWSNTGASAAGIGRAAIVWFIIIQIIASAMGGYLVGRMRIKWATIHTDEVYFRDTAHGFLAWAVGLVVTVAFLGSVVVSMISGAGSATTQISTAGGMGATAQSVEPQNLGPGAYFVDRLFRSSDANAERNDAPARAEAARILANGLRRKNLPAADGAYLAKLVAAKTGLNQAESEQRVSEVFAQMQQTVEIARRAAGHLSLWIFIALLIGAFCASYAATIGGRQRDHVRTI